GLLARGPRIAADDIAGVGRIDVVGGLGSVGPASRDEILMQCHWSIKSSVPAGGNWAGRPQTASPKRLAAGPAANQSRRTARAEVTPAPASRRPGYGTPPRRQSR